MVSIEKGITIFTLYILETYLSCNVKNGIKGARDYGVLEVRGGGGLDEGGGKK